MNPNECNLYPRSRNLVKDWSTTISHKTVTRTLDWRPAEIQHHIMTDWVDFGLRVPRPLLASAFEPQRTRLRWSQAHHFLSKPICCSLSSEATRLNALASSYVDFAGSLWPSHPASLGARSLVTLPLSSSHWSAIPLWPLTDRASRALLTPHSGEV